MNLVIFMSAYSQVSSNIYHPLSAIYGNMRYLLAPLQTLLCITDFYSTGYIRKFWRVAPFLKYVTCTDIFCTLAHHHNDIFPFCQVLAASFKNMSIIYLVVNVGLAISQPALPIRHYLGGYF